MSSMFIKNASDAQKAEYLGKALVGDSLDRMVPLVNLGLIILGWFSLSVEVFLRRQFGERYLSPTRFIMAWFALSIVGYGGPTVGLLGRNFGAAAISYLFFQVTYLLFIGLGFYHLITIFRRNRRGERWYSWSFGVSHFSGLIGTKLPGDVVIDDWLLYRFIEPLIIWGSAFLANFIAPPLTGYLVFVGLVMFVKNNFMYGQIRGRLLDLMDTELERDYLQAALQGASKTETRGLSIVRSPLAIDRNRDGIPDPLQQNAATPPGPADFRDVLADVVGQPSVQVEVPAAPLPATPSTDGATVGATATLPPQTAPPDTKSDAH